jgi:salicylate hydroxylase
LASNASRILCDMGLRKGMDACAIRQNRTVFLNHDEGKVLKVSEYADLEAKVGLPLWQMHRGDLHTILLDKARELGIPIKMGHAVKKYDWEGPSALLDNGTVITADVIVAADG